MVMANSWFKFKQFTIHQDRSAMKVTTDACLFGAWVARQLALRQAQDHSMKILDIGTGTGLLS
jgi:tRNA1Val (adenine37-N6)-methyltransferase